MSPTERPGGVIWICGVPASGKTTLARGLLAWLAERGVVTLWLDSDDLRDVLAREPDYTDAGRDHFYAALAHLARLGADGGATVVVSATAPRRHHRLAVRQSLPPEHLVEIELTCDPTSLRAERDIKGLYARSDAGQITNLPGQGAPFEAARDAELTVDTTHIGPAEVAAHVRAWLRHHRPHLVGGRRP